MTETKTAKPRKPRAASVKTKKIKAKDDVVQVPEAPLPANVYVFQPRAVNDYEEDDGDMPVAQRPKTSASLEDAMAKNAETQRKLTEERAKNNKNVLRSYRIK